MAQEKKILTNNQVCNKTESWSLLQELIALKFSLIKKNKFFYGYKPEVQQQNSTAQKSQVKLCYFPPFI